MIPESMNKGGRYFVVMPRKFDERDVIPPGRFAFIDGKDVKGVNLSVYEICCQDKLHRHMAFLFHCVKPSGNYRSDRAFVEHYVFKTAEEATAKIRRILRGKIAYLRRLMVNLTHERTQT